MPVNDGYVIITPARDEERHIGKTIASVAAQTIPPLCHIVVDDGSSDRTGEIVDSFASKNPWLIAVHRADRGYRNSAGGEIDAFYHGLSFLQSADWNYIVKLDGDLSFNRDYFEKLLGSFRNNASLGIACGTIYNLIGNRLVKEPAPHFHVRGAAKMYRRACWDAMGGIYRINGWDAIDEVKAAMLGWHTENFEALPIIHYRPTGQAVGAFRNAIKNGRGAYAVGYHPLYMLIKCLLRTVSKPILVEASGLLYGFLSGYFTAVPRIEDRQLVSYLRRQQLNRLFFRPTIWK